MRNTVRKRAVFVTADELEAWAAHPAVLIQTIVSLPHVDVRQLSNSLRTLITDANTQQMLPAGNTSSMILVGFADQVAHMATMLRKANEAARVQAVEPAVERFALQFADAGQVAASVEALASPILASTQRSGAAVQGHVQSALRVLPDIRTNSVIAVALPDAMPVVRRIVALLDVEAKE